MSGITWWNIVVIAGSVVLVGMMAVLLVWRLRVRSTARLTASEFADPCEVKVEDTADVVVDPVQADAASKIGDQDIELSQANVNIPIDIIAHENTPPSAPTNPPPDASSISLVAVPMTTKTASTPTPIPSTSSDSQSETDDEAENSPMIPESEREILEDEDMPAIPPSLDLAQANFALPPPPVAMKSLPESSPLKPTAGLSSVPSTPLSKNNERMSAQVKLHALEQQFFPLPSPVAIRHVPESPRYASGSLSHTKQSKLPTFNISVNHSLNGEGIDINMTQQEQQLPPLATGRRNSLMCATPTKRDLEGSIQISTPQQAGLPPMPMLRKRSDSIGGCSYYKSQVPASPMRKINIPSSPMAGSSSSPYRKSLNGSVWSSVSARFAGSHMPGGAGSQRGGSRAGSSLGSYIHAGSANGSIQQPRYTTPAPQIPPSNSHYRTGMIPKPLPNIPQHQHQQQRQQHPTYKIIENMHVIPRPNVTSDGSLDRGVPVGGMGAVLKKNPFYFSDLMSDWERRSGRNQFPSPSPIPAQIVDGSFGVSDADWADLDEANRLREGVDIASSSYWTAFLGEVERLRK